MTVQQFKKAVDSQFEKLGELAEYQNHEVLIFLLRPDIVVSVGFTKSHTATNTMKIRIADAPQLKVGDTITYNDVIYKVSQEPQKDTNNLIWSFEVVCE